MNYLEKCKSHKWGEWEYPEKENYRVRVCDECFETDIDPLAEDDESVMYSCGCHMIETIGGEVLQVLSVCHEHLEENWLLRDEKDSEGE